MKNTNNIFYINLNQQGFVLDGQEYFELESEAIEAICIYNESWKVMEDYSHTIQIKNGKPSEVSFANDADNLCIKRNQDAFYEDEHIRDISNAANRHI